MEPETRLRAHLGRFGFSQEKANTKVANLSGGEKARLLFALMSLGNPHIMLLDEPTNHLDVDAREALVEALNAYEGAVILVSHDPHLINLVADRLWLVEGGTCQVFEGDLGDYERRLLAERKTKKPNGIGNEQSAPGKSENKKDQRRARAEERARTAHLRKQVKESEKLMERLSAKIKKAEKKLSDPETYSGPAETIAGTQKELGRFKQDLAQAEASWLEAHDALESIDNRQGDA